jgi:Fe-S cluster assembly iron-binding protein IscA
MLKSITNHFRFQGKFYATKASKQIFRLTPNARNRITNLLLEKRDETSKGIVIQFISSHELDVIGIRVSTKTGGCNGLTYTMDFIEEVCISSAPQFRSTYI